VSFSRASIQARETRGRSSARGSRSRSGRGGCRRRGSTVPLRASGAKPRPPTRGETPYGFQLVRAVIGDKRAEDAAGPTARAGAGPQPTRAWRPPASTAARSFARVRAWRAIPVSSRNHDACGGRDHRRGAALALVEELRECLGSDTRLLAEHLRRHSGGREPDRVIAAACQARRAGVE